MKRFSHAAVVRLCDVIQSPAHVYLILERGDQDLYAFLDDYKDGCTEDVVRSVIRITTLGLRHDGLWRPLKLFARRPLLSHVYHFPKNRGESKHGRVIGSGRSMASVLYRVVSRFAPNSAGPTTRHPGGAEASVGGKVLREYSTQPARRRRDPQARPPVSLTQRIKK